MSKNSDLLICGAGVGGCAAALAAARQGRSVILAEETDWIGGQLTAQAVPPDENPWIETFGANRSFRAFREGVRKYYRDFYPLTAAAHSDPTLNPGGGFVSRLCHEPRVALAVLESQLAPYISAGLILPLLRHKAIAATLAGDRVQSIVLRSRDSGAEREIAAAYVLDATETGEILPLAGVEYVVGAESQSETSEPHAVSGLAQPRNQQGFTHCFALSYEPDTDHTIERPAQYGFWKDYRAPFWPDNQLSWTDLHPTTLEPRTFTLFGASDDHSLFYRSGEMNWREVGMWHYRRLRCAAHFGGHSPEISLINWAMNDYWLKPIVDVSAADEAAARTDAKQLGLSLLYWLQTEAPHPDGKYGYPGLRLRPDVTGTDDGFAKTAYIRESRRIRAEFTVCEQDIASALRDSAEKYTDSVGIGCYRIDLHPSTSGANFIDIGCHPFQIPLGALLPIRCENLLPACKNLGVTHITNGAYRLHPVEWAIGEAAGALAAFCLDNNVPPRAVRADSARLSDFQALLGKHGIPIEWPRVFPV